MILRLTYKNTASGDVAVDYDVPVERFGVSTGRKLLWTDLVGRRGSAIQKLVKTPAEGTVSGPVTGTGLVAVLGAGLGEWGDDGGGHLVFKPAQRHIEWEPGYKHVVPELYLEDRYGNVFRWPHAYIDRLRIRGRPGEEYGWEADFKAGSRETGSLPGSPTGSGPYETLSVTGLPGTLPTTGISEVSLEIRNNLEPYRSMGDGGVVNQPRYGKLEVTLEIRYLLGEEVNAESWVTDTLGDAELEWGDNQITLYNCAASEQDFEYNPDPQELTVRLRCEDIEVTTGLPVPG